MGIGDGVKPCSRGMGETGRPIQQADNISRPKRYVAGLEQLASTQATDIYQVVPMIDFWQIEAGSRIGLGSWSLGSPFLADGTIRHHLVLHPESLSTDRVRVRVEYRSTGPNPLLSVLFDVDGSVVPAPSIPVALGDGWFLRTFTVVREAVGEPLGNLLDMMIYDSNDIEVRDFDVSDIGAKGDVNLDGGVNILDVQVVLDNMFSDGALNIEDGDTDLNGVVDAADLMTVIDDINN
jgi:hypothetical protein